MFDPISTYRIQFHKHFNFSALEAIIPYLRKLGIRTIYASPIFHAVPGSVHGYDVLDPNVINPEIGTLEQLYAISRKLKEAGMSWVQDIVPNHMALYEDNPWLADVLEHGQNSTYARYFDIDWNHSACNGKIMLPVLGGEVEDALHDGKIRLTLREGSLMLDCNGACYRLSRTSVDLIASAYPGNVSSKHGTWYEDTAALDQLNENTGLMRSVLEQQHYQLCHWQVTDREINYRRFFTINGLIGLNIQHEEVFAAYHALIAKLCAEGVFQGLRVDHVDGLLDPSGYLYRLRQLVGPEQYIVVEKILEPGEDLLTRWPVEGTTGYDFLGAVNNLFTDAQQFSLWVQHYRMHSGDERDPRNIAWEKKRLILEGYMQGEANNLCRIAKDLFPQCPVDEDILTKALSALLVYCPVYKFYANQWPFPEKDFGDIRSVLDEAKKQEPGAAPGLEWLIQLFSGSDATVEGNAVLYFYQRCMQFSGPLMAKGVEDTMMYTYNQCIVHCEVGDRPDAAGITAESFGDFLRRRQSSWPLAMNATATHDTKRGEDARARLNALTAYSKLWIHYVDKWEREWGQVTDDKMPAYAVRYLIYQSLVASCPADLRMDQAFRERFEAFLLKALREAKECTSWSQPDTQHEEQALSFFRGIMDHHPFVADLGQLLQQIADAGFVNSLQQVILKYTCPGVPDLYQGNELWDFSMVDPDNRRPVDYTLREQLLNDMSQRRNEASLAMNLWKTRADGGIKLLVTHQLLQARLQHADVFAKGTCTMLPVSGKYRAHILAYVRRYQSKSVLVVLALHTARLAEQQGCAITAIDWADTAVNLKGGTSADWNDLFQSNILPNRESMPLSELLPMLPFGVYYQEQLTSVRGCGILLPVFSLPSPEGIGDFGPSAHRFIDFLQSAAQRYWQILPLNPVHRQQAYSPYSSSSAMALNPLMISVALLQQYGLLEDTDIKRHTLSPDHRIDYEACSAYKWDMLNKAYTAFQRMKDDGLLLAFIAFCDAEKEWLEDYALFVVLNEQYKDQPWNEWPEPYRDRHPDALADFAQVNAHRLTAVRWFQFIAGKQWCALKEKANAAGISVIGDLPFYLNHHAAEVWAHPEIFNLDASKRMKVSAGVPPDYFSTDGQLWGMPTYKWEVLRNQDYDWWMDRLRRNVQLFDLVRLDHFRAFESFWEVDATEKSAVNGRWAKGPGKTFFDMAEARLGKLPFIAEDLGYEMDAVYALRTQVGLPGMKVLQFAWGEDMPKSVDVPHNFTPTCIVYSGTHDNNTTRGWYCQETDLVQRRNLSEYAGREPDEHTVSALMIRMAYASVAKTAIIPMHDVLNKGADCRTNTPGQASGNWQIRFSGNDFTPELAGWLHHLATFYNRR